MGNIIQAFPNGISQSELNTKADKVESATANSLAGLDATGNLTDAGWSSLKTTTSATGNPISISGLKSNQLAINPIITFEPIQAGSGDPSPSNVRAISGYDKIEVLSCGKNLFDASLMTSPETSAKWVQLKLLANTIYTVSSNIPDSTTSAYIFAVAGTNTSSATSGANGVGNGRSQSITTGNDGIISIGYRTEGASGILDLNNYVYQVELGSFATTYEPYHKTTDISESIGQTVYGGSLDVRTGVLTVNREILDLSTLTGWQGSAGGWYKDKILFAPNMKAGTTDLYAERYEASNSQAPNTIRVAPSGNLSIYSTEVPTGKLVYPLITPFTIQLTPHEISLLKDYAYVSTNGTSIAFDYHNGEIASLGDVSQLGETVNELGNNIQTYNSGDVIDINGYYVAFASRYTGLYMYIPLQKPLNSNITMDKMVFSITNLQVLLNNDGTLIEFSSIITTDSYISDTGLRLRLNTTEYNPVKSGIAIVTMKITLL